MEEKKITGIRDKRGESGKNGGRERERRGWEDMRKGNKCD